MEFPDLGEQCSQSDCQRLDFIPLRCECSKYFCKDHFLPHCLSGECTAATVKKNATSGCPSSSIIFKCSFEKCKTASLVEMPCIKCKEHFCITHRFHEKCYGLNCDIDSQIEKYKLELEEDQKHERTRQLIEAEVTERLRKAEQSSKAKTAIKIQLMKLKSKAVGEKSITNADRMYLAVRCPKDATAKALITSPRHIQMVSNFNDVSVKSIYVSKNWSIGRCIDSISNFCSVMNENNINTSPKLRLFRESDGMCISVDRLDQTIQALLDNKTIIDGERVVLEYIPANFLYTVDKNIAYFIC